MPRGREADGRHHASSHRGHACTTVGRHSRGLHVTREYARRAEQGGGPAAKTMSRQLLLPLISLWATCRAQRPPRQQCSAW